MSFNLLNTWHIRKYAIAQLYSMGHFDLILSGSGRFLTV